jgi:hypothetical protein
MTSTLTETRFVCGTQITDLCDAAQIDAFLADESTRRTCVVFLECSNRNGKKLFFFYRTTSGRFSAPNRAALATWLADDHQKAQSNRHH